MRCLTYARARASDKVSEAILIQKQLKMMRDYAAAKEWEVVGEFLDRGVSANDKQRPGLCSVLAACCNYKGEIALLACSFDRLSRTLPQSIELLSYLTRHRVLLVLTSPMAEPGEKNRQSGKR
jgi:site-specific DNA recombinase